MTSAHTDRSDSWSRSKANIKTLVSAILLATFIRIVLFEAFEIEGYSMEPTLLNGDRVIVAKFLYGLFLPFTNEALVNWGGPDLGDVVIVRSPADDIDIVKRVVGVAGDRLRLVQGILHRNGKAIAHQDLGLCQGEHGNGRGSTRGACLWRQERVGQTTYRVSYAKDSPASTTPAVRVPEGHVFVLGDHRDSSNDSRFFGPVPLERIKGKALSIYWSSHDGDVRWGRLGHGIE